MRQGSLVLATVVALVATAVPAQATVQDHVHY